MSSPAFTLVPFSDELAPAFRSLNMAWIEQLFTVEPADLEVLDDPQGRIMAGGGEIFFALVDGEPVGCCAAMPVGNGRWEMTKMAVDPRAQGRGIGRALGEAVIRHARSANAAELHLMTNSSLTTAIRIYERLGFEHREMPADNHYARGDVYMVLKEM